MKLRHLIQIGVILSAILLIINRTTSQWEQTNGPPGGFVCAIALNSGGDIFTGVWAGGVFRSSNGVLAWKSLGDPQLSVTALAINNADHIFAVFDSVIRSTDNGETWEKADSGIGGPVCSIIIEPGGDLFAGTRGSGVFRSTNNGSSWMDASGPGLTNFFCYAFASFSDGHVFMATEDGIFRTTDDGEHWSHIGLSGISIGQLLLGKGGNIFAGHYSVSDGGVYRSDDSGQTWTKFDAGLTDKTIKSLFQSANGYLYVGTTHGGVFRSTDNGESWDQANTGLTGLFARSFAFDSTQRLLVGTDAGISASTDNGDTWNQIGVPHSFANCISISSDDVVFASTYEGVWRSTDNGANWHKTALNQNATLECFTFNFTDYVFAGSDTSYSSTDRGNTWNQINSGIVSPIQCFACDSNGCIYAGTGNGVLRSNEVLTNWMSIGLDSFIVNSIAIAPNGVLFTGTERLRPYSPHNGVFRSTDNGVNWTQVLDEMTIGCLLIHSDGSIIAATRELTSRTYRSTDNGDTWTVVTHGLRGTVRSLAMNSLGHTFAGTSAGVFCSTNHGDSWLEVTLGLPSLTVTDVGFNSVGIAFAATYGNGVYRTTQSMTTLYENMHELTNIFLLRQNYPNPANPSTQITYSLPKPTHVTLKIYDLLGREITVLVNEHKPAGEYSVTWNAEGAPCGVYFYRIVAGEFIETKKMVLLK